MACPVTKEEPHRNFARDDHGNKLVGSLVREQMKKCTSRCWDGLGVSVMRCLRF